MKSNEQYYRDLAASSTSSISGSLLRGYASRMAVVESPAPFAGSGEQSSARAAIPNCLRGVLKQVQAPNPRKSKTSLTQRQERHG